MTGARVACAALAALVGGTAHAGDATPRVPKLGGEPPPPAAADAEPARRLPPTIAVCRDDAGRCWTATTATGCAGSPGATVYRVVPATPDDAEPALAACRAGEGRHPR